MKSQKIIIEKEDIIINGPVNSGLIRINEDDYINPAFIRKYNFADKELELINGKILKVSDEYSNQLLQYFKNYM